MSSTDAGRSTNVATLAHRPSYPTPPPPNTSHATVCDDAATDGAPGTDSGRPARSVGYQRVQSGTLIHLPAASPSTTLIKDARRRVVNRPSTPRPMRSLSSDIMQLSAGMTTTLCAELEGSVAREFVAEIVRAVLDESRQGAQGRAVESLILEARLRLGRFIRAGSSG